MLNFDARHDLEAHPSQTASGMIKVEVRDESGQALPGYKLDDFAPLCTNTANLPACYAPVQWKDGRSLKDLAGRRVRFCFVLRDCHLYTFKAGRAEAGGAMA